MSTPPPLRRSPLHPAHLELGARLVPFAGWEMPVQYRGVIAEHLATRRACGLFDVSHMGEVEVAGPAAVELLELLTPNDPRRLAPGRAQYSALTTERGTFVDDVIVYRLAAERFLLVVNAANRARDLDWIEKHGIDGARVRDVSDDWALLALQGPAAGRVLAPLAPGLDLGALAHFSFAEARLAGVAGALVARTGYTGEDGFELFVPAGDGLAVWRALVAAGRDSGLEPCGLAARDTLRLEARLPLYGNDIDLTTTVVEAGLGWIVRQGDDRFLGAPVLGRERREGPRRRLSGFEMVGRGIARHGFEVQVGGERVGTVTSGSHAPSLDKNIGLVYLPAERSAVGTELEVEIRGKAVPARVVPTPFYPHRTLAARKRPA